MARIYIDNPISSGFSMVPNILWRWPGLTFKAKGFFAYLLSHRDGSCPPVAAMEAETGLGRDARKAAMAELIAAGLARWVIERDRSERILSKRLEVTTRPLLVALAHEPAGAPENPSHGGHAPENPSDGKSVAVGAEIRRCATENPAILQNLIQKRGARKAARRALPPQEAARRAASSKVVQPVGCADIPDLAQAVGGLSAWEKNRLRSGGDLLLPGLGLVKPGTAVSEALRSALRASEAGL